MERAAVGAAEERLELALALPVEVGQALVGVVAEHSRGDPEELREHDGDRTRDHALLDHEPVPQLVLLADVDDPGDAGPDGGELAHVVVAEADPVDRTVGVVAEGEEVAVPAEAGAELVRERQTLLARAEQQLGRAERARPDHDQIGGDEHLGRVERVAPDVDRLEVHEPASVAPLHVAHLDPCVDLRAVIPGVGEVVHDQRVLGGVVAAADAVAAQPAGLLVDADVVDAVRLVVDVDRRPVEPLTEALAGRLEGSELLELREVVGIGAGPEHLRRAGVAVSHAVGVVPESLRPDGIREHARLGREDDARVDERGAAEAAADEHADLLVRVEVVEAGLRADVAVLVVHLELRRRLGCRVRVLARLELPPTLEHADTLAGPRQPGGRNRRAVARADDDRVVVRAEVLERRREPVAARVLGRRGGHW